MRSLSNVRDVKVSEYVLEIICEAAHHIVELQSDSWLELQDFLTQFVKGELEMDFARDLILLKLLGDLVGELPPETIPRNVRGCLLDSLIKFTSKMDFYDESTQQTSASAAYTSIIVLAFLRDYGDLTPKALRLFGVIRTTMLDLLKFDKDLCLKLMEDMRVYFEMLLTYVSPRLDS
ncbi:hypothetical protein RHMOL_Rhmol11G0098600 [Rhododendron molle]|uniref:Uncharacterized protein n=1 Tax=Rhododendron molle TaxID=49168 RepID=A0ACC0LRG5_RHOML|nr:hypothetical protein RHMOL_Rhmol11G0098600 [Rhododendron molle]